MTYSFNFSPLFSFFLTYSHPLHFPFSSSLSNPFCCLPLSRTLVLHSSFSPIHNIEIYEMRSTALHLFFKLWYQQITRWTWSTQTVVLTMRVKYNKFLNVPFLHASQFSIYVATTECYTVYLYFIIYISFFNCFYWRFLSGENLETLHGRQLPVASIKHECCNINISFLYPWFNTVPHKCKLPPIVSFFTRRVSFLSRCFSFLSRRFSFLSRITEQKHLVWHISRLRNRLLLLVWVRINIFGWICLRFDRYR